MLLLETFVLATVFSYGSSQVRLTQPQLSITREGNKAIRIDCRVSLSEDFGKAPIHWYRQRPGAAPERILFISTQSEFDRVSDKGKFNAEKKIGQSTCTLTINKITSSDIATYYCAYWDRTVLENIRQPVQKPTLHSEPQPFACMRPLSPPLKFLSAWSQWLKLFIGFCN
ncbi:unnamed protein product [Caretta caretta]